MQDREVIIPRVLLTHLLERNAALVESLRWCLENETDVICVNGELECVHCRAHAPESAGDLKHADDCKYVRACSLVYASGGYVDDLDSLIATNLPADPGRPFELSDIAKIPDSPTTRHAVHTISRKRGVGAS